MQLAMDKGHTISKTVSYQMTTKAAWLEIEDAEAQRLTIEEVDGPMAPKVQLNNLDRLVNWSKEFLGRRDNDRVYPVPINHHQNDQGRKGPCYFQRLIALKCLKCQKIKKISNPSLLSLLFNEPNFLLIK